MPPLYREYQGIVQHATPLRIRTRGIELRAQTTVSGALTNISFHPPDGAATLERVPLSIGCEGFVDFLSVAPRPPAGWVLSVSLASVRPDSVFLTAWEIVLSAF
ncbi:unnamed protein product, partial [Iphiclides podalirius]